MTLKRKQSEVSKQQGATRKVTKPSRTEKKWGRKLLAVTLLCAFCIGISQLNFAEIQASIDAAIYKPVTDVNILGRLEYASEKQIQTVIREELSEDFVKVNIRSLRNKLLDIAWIEKVSVRRIWPEKLEIQLTEHVPIARWGEDAVINQYGKKIEVGENGFLQSLPYLSVQRSDEAEVVSKYLFAQEKLDALGFNVNELEVSAINEWTFKVNSRVILNFGQGALTQKLDRLSEIYQKKLRNKVKEISSVDLRHKNAVAIQWQVESSEKYVASNGILLN